MADYLGKKVDFDMADWSLQQAELFVETIDKVIFSGETKK